jgi:hypothetical protein
MFGHLGASTGRTTRHGDGPSRDEGEGYFAAYALLHFGFRAYRDSCMLR